MVPYVLYRRRFKIFYFVYDLCIVVLVSRSTRVARVQLVAESRVSDGHDSKDHLERMLFRKPFLISVRDGVCARLLDSASYPT